MNIQKITASFLALAMIAGCRVNKLDDFKLADNSVNAGFQAYNPGSESLTIEEPMLDEPFGKEQFAEPPLMDFNFDDPSSYHKITLADCIDHALKHSTVMRDLGGNVLRAPTALGTVHDPALAYTDPRTGEEAALSAFDANLETSLLYDRNDRAFNNRFAGRDGILLQDLAQYQFGLAKRSATGSIFQFNHGIEYDRNNNPSNRYNNDRTGVTTERDKSSAFDVFLEAEVRQPLLQGAGINFNRIAGPNNPIGVNNGILIARTNTDISLAEFERGIRDLISNVENAYWDLYFSYRDLDTKIEARDGALRIWQVVSAKAEAERKDADAGDVAQAEEQYFRFAADVENAIHGRLQSGTQTNNGSSGGTFRNNPGVRTAERRLRLLMGFDMNSGQLLLPNDNPIESPVVFDWEAVKNDALSMRAELRKQRWQVKQSELNLVANRYRMLPQLDLIAKYRVRGFGHNLYAGEGSFEETDAFNPDSNAYRDLLSFDRAEWQTGFEFSMPLGFRRAASAVRNSQLQLARNTAILREQERYVVFGLSNAVGELTRADSVRKAQLNRLNAANKQLEAIREKYSGGNATIDLVLEAQRRVIDSKQQYFQTQVEYMLGIKSVHFEKGTLLEYHQIHLTESAWAPEAYRQAAERRSLEGDSMNYVSNDLVISNGRAPEAVTQTPPIQPKVNYDLGPGEILVPNGTPLGDGLPPIQSSTPSQIPVETVPIENGGGQFKAAPTPSPMPVPDPAAGGTSPATKTPATKSSIQQPPITHSPRDRTATIVPAVRQNR